MPIKLPRGDDEITQFAAELAGRWRQGDGVEPWLRMVEPEFSQKVRHERWSWESIARTLNLAGIVYGTGHPWTGRSLLRKITSVRYEARATGRVKAADLGSRATAFAAGAAAARLGGASFGPSVASTGLPEPDEPMIPLPTFHDGHRPTLGTLPKPPPPVAEPATGETPEQIYNRVFGLKPNS